MGKTTKENKSRVKKDSPTSVTSLKKSDLQALESFLEKVSFEDVVLGDWASVHSHADVQVCVFVTEDEIKAPFTKTVEFSRERKLVVEEKNGVKRVIRQREKMSVNVDVPQFVEDGHRIMFQGMGDEFGERPSESFGHLHVIIKKR